MKKLIYVVMCGVMCCGLLIAGCRSIADARAAKGQGTTRVYDASFDTVWAAIPAVLDDCGLKIAGDNKQEGYITAEKGFTPGSMGEKVAVFVTRLTDDKTQVEVVSMKAVATEFLAWDWEKPILNKLSEKLGQK
jgi:predicted RNA-binding protein (virulence factor B family)